MLPAGSNTFAGIAVALLPTLFGVFHINLMPGASEQITQAVSEIITLAGSMYAVYGRITATKLFVETPPSA